MEKLIIGRYCLDSQVPNLSSTRLSTEYFIDLKAIVVSRVDRQWVLFVPTTATLRRGSGGKSAVLKGYDLMFGSWMTSKPNQRPCSVRSLKKMFHTPFIDTVITF